MVKYKNKNSGKTYDVEVGQSYKDKNGNEVQPITINGQKMTLSVQQTADNSGKNGKDVVLKINVDGKDITNDGGYTGLKKSEIYSILSARAKSGKATQLEQIAVFQQQYNNCAKAEAVAKGLSENDADLLKLTDKQISGKEPLPDLAKSFPWTQASQKDEFSAKCRVALKEVEKTAAKYDWFDEMHINPKNKRGKIKDQFAMQEKASKAKQKLGNTALDKGTERLVAAAEKKKEEKEKQAKSKTKNVSTYTPRSNDGVSMG